MHIESMFEWKEAKKNNVIKLDTGIFCIRVQSLYRSYSQTERASDKNNGKLLLFPYLTWLGAINYFEETDFNVVTYSSHRLELFHFNRLLFVVIQRVARNNVYMEIGLQTFVVRWHVQISKNLRNKCQIDEFNCAGRERQCVCV